ncbi:histone-lysine N-methyltransferase NSD2-like isoform X1 [Myxocyprinus asiaticus]|uniref:histone-lysine N-methyltransferase NSD2-like isoform X1 n=1 Tax=Myxocyprinus asiaticus TaxID=70543 RepID=UPI0022218764|nr:histone-lysine N-methyltransferase NSD2-like isoform X1 [Myxocyprinus asiaticus]XP_051504393.1 histone-lysine N-methyltransferase NSD2-like isoform X1 [Myxocyprinus asiaticus]XP_051504394.1 histone-lysine N-methyltransferase NSD2-like isoform X1 [Myxocyprinus asiaticus]XP_051504395.1 histone-lysine N-methyltransferase NSD2-like isoform X1 [Myxocyprinus asiaticus]
MTDSKGRSLPAMPEPRSPTTMKQPSDSPGGHKGRGDGSTDPSILMDKSATQLAATPQESVLQMIGNHNHTHGHNHTHERLKDLTSRLLNGDQDKIPKLCAATAAQPLLKGVEPVPQHASPPRKSIASPELTLKITKLVVNGKPSRYEADYVGEGTEETNAPSGLSEGVLGSPTASRERRKRKRGLVRKRTPLNLRRPILSPTVNADRSPLLHATLKPHDLTSDPCVLPTKSNQQTNCERPANQPMPECEVSDVAQGVDEVKASDTETQPHVQYSVGDIIWTKVSGYPWWPCMITTDPEFDVHFRLKVNGRKGMLYHVQYFGDAPERGYVFEKSIVTFSGKDQYESLSRGNKLSETSGRKRSIPRKIREQWEIGVLQATEALSLLIEERLNKFSYVYEEGIAQFNPHMLQELQAQHNQEPQQDHRESQQLVSLTPPDSTQSSPNSTKTSIKDLAPPTDISTSAGKTTLPRKAPKTSVKRDRRRQCPATPKREKTAATSAKEIPLTEFTVQNPCTASETLKPQRKRQTRAGKRTTRKKDILCIGLDLQPKAPQKKQRQLRQKFPAAPNSVKRRRAKAGVSISDTLKAESSNPGLSDIVVSTPSQKPVKDKADAASKGRKKGSKRLREESKEEGVTSQPRKKSRLEKGLKNQRSQKKTTSDEATFTTQRRRKQKSDRNEPRKRSRKASREESPAKVKRVRKRKQQSGRQSLPASSKKRRPSDSPEPERPDSPSDSTDESQTSKKTERTAGAKKECVCLVCERTGEDLVLCEGQCFGSYHLQCIGLERSAKKVLCTTCSSDVHVCFTCKKFDGEVRRCCVLHCGRFYHESCVQLSDLTVFENRGFRCPLHTCLSCHNSGRGNAKATKGKMMRCLRCPVAYHVGDLCVAAGSEMLSSTAIVCTNHFRAKKGYSHHSHVNVSWCFICSKGGRLLCCESCPAAFHPDCLNIAMPDGSWFCNDCRSGKKPRYRDIIWVKLGNYRWWPAEIRHPKNIPTNIQHLRHEIGEFPVFFFGSKDYFWTHQGRVFPYMEGDRGSKHQQTGIGKVFKNALLEAEARFNEIKMEQEAKEAHENNKKPPPYKFIKVNKPCGRVQVYTADTSEIPKCNCKPSDERPCSFESECLNRMLLYECHPQVCPAAERCQNQDFTKRLYPDTKIIRTAGKGWGLLSMRDIKKGEFVNEYVGELIDEEECRARIRYAQENDITHFYMLTIDKDRIIDAGPKGNFSRFMNHSCQPNCETQKWTVNGDTRVGLFAVCDIPAGTELTFNYNLDCLGNEKTVCRCGAPNCSGFLGDRPKNGHSSEPKAKHQKKKAKRRRSRNEGKKSEDECFRCGDGGELVLCDKKGCTKAYHLSCLDRTKRPFGRWDCPWHHCDVCGKNSDAFCQLCPNSFCQAHQEGALQLHPLTGQLCCQEHEDSDLRLQVETPVEKTSTTKPRKYRCRAEHKSNSKTALKKKSKKAAEV